MLVKVTDFGIARALSTISKDEKNDVVWGSPHYFSPEQASGLPPSPASDVYSLGVIFYELLTGVLPFDGRDSAELSRRHRTEEPVPPRMHNPEIPEQLEKIILKVLSKEPSARYRTADQLGRLLQGFYETQYRGAVSTLMTGPAALGVTGASQVLQAVGDAQQAPEQLPAEEPFQPLPQSIAEVPVFEAIEPREAIDWLTWVLGIVAFLFLIGLVPFWFYIYQMIGR